MNRRQMVMAGRCRECGAKGHTPHTDECKWIGGVCEYQLQAPQETAMDGDATQLSIYENDCDTVIAYSPEDAMAVWEDHIGDSYTADEYGTVDDWTPRKGESLRIHFDGDIQTRTHAEWIDKEGRSFLCSTEF